MPRWDTQSHFQSPAKQRSIPGRALALPVTLLSTLLPTPPLLSYRQQKSLGLWISEHFPMPRNRWSHSGTKDHAGRFSALFPVPTSSMQVPHWAQTQPSPPRNGSGNSGVVWVRAPRGKAARRTCSEAGGGCDPPVPSFSNTNSLVEPDRLLHQRVKFFHRAREVGLCPQLRLRVGMIISRNSRVNEGILPPPPPPFLALEPPPQIPHCPPPLQPQSKLFPPFCRCWGKKDADVSAEPQKNAEAWGKFCRQKSRVEAQFASSFSKVPLPGCPSLPASHSLATDTDTL